MVASLGLLDTIPYLFLIALSYILLGLLLSRRSLTP